LSVVSLGGYGFGVSGAGYGPSWRSTSLIVEGMYWFHSGFQYVFEAGILSVKLRRSPANFVTHARIRPAVIKYLSTVYGVPGVGCGPRSVSSPVPHVSPPWCCVQLGAKAQ
jgi:hypothetical protein